MEGGVKGMKLFLIFCTVVAVCHGAGCASKLDIVFVVDGSGSINSYNWMLIQDFLIEVINRLDVSIDGVHVGMVLYSTEARTMWTLADRPAYTKRNLLRRIRDLPYLNGRTATPNGLLYARMDVLEAPGAREGVKKLAIVITDGKANEYLEYFEEDAAELKDIARVVAIGVTDKIDFDELELIASTPCDIQTVDYFEEMDADMDATMDFICGCMPGHSLDQEQCECNACETGMYQSEWGQMQCENCPYGQDTLEEMGAVECQDVCPTGSYHAMEDDVTGSCELCRVGFYQPQSGQETCVACPSGFSTRIMGAQSRNQCKLVCGRGERVENIDGVMRCIQCPVGTYQPGTFADMCIQCPDGYNTRQIGSTHLSQCEHVCPTGSYHTMDDDVTGSCELCRVGFYQPQSGQETCVACPSGFSTRIMGAQSRNQCKLVCGRGERVENIDGVMRCIQCPVGTYQPGTFADMCMECPDGYNTRQIGSTHLSQCELVCEAGQEPNGNGTMCVLCPIGTYQPMGFQRQCDTCPPGESTRDQGAIHVDICETLNPPQQSTASGKSSNAGVIAGAVIGSLVLLALLVLLAFFLLRLYRRRAYGHSESRANSWIAPVLGKMEKGLKDEPTEKPENHYNEDPTAKKNPYNSPYDNGASKESPYDNGASKESPYDNGASKESPYDNGEVEEENIYDVPSDIATIYDNGTSSPNTTYDNGAQSSAEHAYDNGAQHDTTYDNGAQHDTTYDNQANDALENAYDNDDDDVDHIYNNIDDIEQPASTRDSTSGVSHPHYEVPRESRQGQGHGLDNPGYANT